MSHVKPFMTPKMYPAVPISNGGRRVTVTGPINWDTGSDPQEIAAVFTLVVSQISPNGGVVSAIGWATTTYTNEADWSARANVVGPASLEFVPGGATVAAWATIAHSDGGYAIYEWTLPVMLQ